MELGEYLGLERGRCAALASALSVHRRLAGERAVTAAYLSQMGNGSRPVPPSLAPLIEQLSGMQVRRWEMRQDDWHQIWPDLIASEGAPSPKGNAQAAA